MKSIFYRLRRSLAWLFLLVSIYFAMTAAFVWQYGKRDEACPADTAIVLGAGLSRSGVSPVFRERINHGVWLYQQGYVHKLLLTGGYGEGSTYSDAHVAAEYAEQQGVPAEDILCEEHSKITEENLRYSAEIMEQEGLKTAILVSDPLHMKRAMLVAKDAGITAYSSPTPTTRYITLKTRLCFLGREVFYLMGYRMLRLTEPKNDLI